MGYCDGSCEKLNSRYHKCDKYGKKLAYMKQSGRGSVGFCVHEQCRECQLDEWNKKLEQSNKGLYSVLTDLISSTAVVEQRKTDTHLEELCQKAELTLKENWYFK